MNNMRLILASQSPRRKQLLEQIGVIPECCPVDIDETKSTDETPLQYCERLAYEKANAGWNRSNKDKLVLGSDTIVVFKGETLGKPKDKKDAFRMLQLLSNQTHQVITAVSVVNNFEYKTAVSVSEVQFRTLEVIEINEYIDSNEPMDKAGSYGIQGLAAQWVKRISGSYSGIMGLPLFETAQLLREHS